MPTHQDRITKPMIRTKITDPWREVSWDEALEPRGLEVKRIQAKYGRFRSAGSPPAAAPTRRSFLVQKLVRAGFGNNNVDTCARVCHSPTGYGLKTTFGTSAGTQDFDIGRQGRCHPRDRRQPDRRPPGLRLADEEGGCARARADRRRSAPDRSRQIAAYRGGLPPPLQPGTNVALVNAIAHVIVTEGLIDEDYVRERCDLADFEDLGPLHRRGAPQLPRRASPFTGVPPG
jgi:formate dehydrogenase major subunit